MRRPVDSPSPPRPARFAPAAAVRLAPGAELDAQQTVSATLLRLDADRLLAPFRREAGICQAVASYGGWEADGLDGHTAGHVLSAASTLAAGGDAAAAALAQALVRGIRECQLARGTGYVGGVPDGEALWDELRAGRIDAGAFHLNGRWVPLYNLHKILAGLIDAVELTGDPVAREALAALGAWWLRVASGLDDDAFAEILECEFGGMTEAFARLALLRHDGEVPGDAADAVAYLRLARRFARRGLVEPLAEGRDELDGLHANTQIPVAVGFATTERAARVVAPELLPDVETREGAAARVFFDRVARHRSAAIGGDSVREHFPQGFASMFIAREGPETCNTHNMVKLAAELHALTDDDAYLLWAERARANHLRSAQHPVHGGLVYFTPQRPAHYRVYSPEAEGFWCCMGSGFEAQSRHGALVFAIGADGDELRVNALVASRAELDGVEVVVEVDEQADPSVVGATIAVRAVRPTRLAVLIPDWVDGDAGVEVLADGGTDAAPRRAAPGTRLRLPVPDGASVVRLRLPRRLRFERPADGSDWAWIVDGPDVLAQRLPDSDPAYRGSGARMGHIAVGALRPLADTPVLAPDALDRARRLGPGRVLVPTADGGSVELEPFARIHDARYTVAWPLAAATDAASAVARRSELERLDAASLGLEARTRDVVGFGEQQPESDHGLEASDEEIGVRGDARWRRTRGSITVTLRDWSGTADALRISWFAGDDAEHLRVVVAGEVVLDEAVPPGSGEATREVPVHVAPGTVEFPVRLEAGDIPTPRLRELRLLAAASDR
ncbi:glycoside hydrolase family 127 protein [Microbacterium sp. M3]|uniref:Glycoside hydrolase family 127 protein n=1 Tax=Microbacterium arthrosphaerae TaxID=792652 RepID=A0ABU4GY82_9MICO|nr:MULTISPECIES: beta-L-arabinofuranosidase domain-containing protein [Microbacterium]MDW4572026.1 glycoside hydrolase family 127 protein [Microbacterium arthrosphaerae]MDW7605881.1 glycoside hydrolase family 127 protein [Microbacterium sp. M3]